MSEQYPKAVVCRVLGVARSSLYRRSSVVPDENLDAAMKDICAEFPCYGYRRVTAELQKARLVDQPETSRTSHENDGIAGQKSGSQTTDNEQ